MTAFMLSLWMLWTSITAGAVTVTSSGVSELREGGLLIGLVNTTITERSKIFVQLNEQGQPTGNESRYTMEQKTTQTLRFRTDGKADQTMNVRWSVYETITKKNGVAVVGNLPTFTYTEQIEWVDIIDLISAPIEKFLRV